MLIPSRPAPPRDDNREPRSGSRSPTLGLIVLMVSMIALPGISLGGDRPIPRATVVHQTQAVANHEDSPVASADRHPEAVTAIKAADRHAEVLTALKAAETLLTHLWLAVEVPMAPIESQQWLIAYFRQGWGSDMATALASHYSYAKGEDLYLRFTDDLLPGLHMAIEVNVIGLTAGEATVHAEFPAIDGPMRYQPSSRLYSLIVEEERWKVARVTVILSEPPVPPLLVAPRKQGESALTLSKSRDN